MTDTIFSDQSNTTDSSTTQSPAILDEFVGEGKRFKDVATLLKSKFEGDMHIKTVESENAELRRKLAEYEATLKEALKPQQSSKDTETSAPALTDEEIEARINKQIEKKSQKDRELANIQTVDKAVKEQFGGDVSKAQVFIQQKAEELGMSVKALMDMAKESPKAFFSAVGMNTQPNKTGPTTVTPYRNSEAAGTSSEPQARTWPWYEKMRKDNPKLYWSPQMQKQLIEDAERMEAAQPGSFGLPSRR